MARSVQGIRITMRAAWLARWKYAESIAGGFVWLCIAAWLLHSCYFAPPAQPTPLKRTLVEEWLADCTPFQALDGHRTLDFYGNDHSVVESEREASLGDDAIEKPGVWLANEETHRVTIDIDGLKSEYRLMRPADFYYDLCILLSGSVTDADLTKSLFAHPYGTIGPE
jgi:hypothetical protein